MRNKKLQERLFVRLPRDTEQQLYMLAVMRGTTRSEILREAIQEKLEKELKTGTAQGEGGTAEEIREENYVNNNLS